VLRDNGVGPGDKVALLCFNTPGFVIALFGAWRLGAVVVPINHKLQAPEIDYMLAHSGSRLCVVDGGGPLGTVLYPEEAIAKAGSIGRSGVPGVAIEVRRADGQRCTAGEVGEIHLRSPAVMKGYLDNPEATAAAFDPQGWYRTGDLARVDEDGFLFIVDRLRDMIITGGENVYSKEIEDALATHPDVQDVAVIGRPHPEWGETVTAVLVARTVARSTRKPCANSSRRAWHATRSSAPTSSATPCRGRQPGSC
jgi:acyl-CoA synthetase (AMP-forming)/AMP-acid ligase II